MGAEQAEDERLEPTKEWVKDLVDEIIAEEFGSPDLELAWLDEDEADPKGLEAVLEGRLKLGAVTLNEMRDVLGLDPYANAAADRPMVLTATGYVPIEANAGGEASRPTAPTGRNGEDPGAEGIDARGASSVQKYNADQPRVPAGNPHGGEWTSGGGSGTSPASTAAAVAEEQPHSGRRPQYAALETNVISDAGEGATHSSTPQDSSEQRIEVAGNDWRNLPVNLADEEAPNGPGHAIRKHVGKTEAELLGEFQQDNRYGWFLDEIRKREGSFDSVENANDLVNQTLRANSEQVDRVANGQDAKAYVKYRFGFVTGYEVYRTDPNYPRFKTRKTYGVGVRIIHDPYSPRGFRVITAYPQNFD